MSDNEKNAWVRLWHPGGVQVTVPIMDEPTPPDVFRVMFDNVTAALTAGFLPREQGLEQGETTVEIGSVVRRSKDNQDRSTTPIIDMYPSESGRNKFKVISHYLNTDQDVAEFLAHSGFTSLNAIPNYVGAGTIERGVNRQADTLIAACPRNFVAVLKANPQWSQAEADAAAAKQTMYPVPKRKFVRYGGEAGPAPQGQPSGRPQAGGAKPDHPRAREYFRKKLELCPNTVECNAIANSIKNDQNLGDGDIAFLRSLFAQTFKILEDAELAEKERRDAAARAQQPSYGDHGEYQNSDAGNDIPF